MTEAEWLVSSDPTWMLAFLRGSASERKLRLFAVACCRRSMTLLLPFLGVYREGMGGAAVAERYADGSATAEDLVEARRRLDAARNDRHGAPDFATARRTEELDLTADAALWDMREAGASLRSEEQRQASFLRDLFGNPFRPSPPLPPAVLRWNDGTVRRLAQAIYEGRQMPEGILDAGRLGILADALLDAGYDDEGLLAHLRSAGPHVRGCWAVDVILGRS
jgi:hypothetical protein